MSTQSQTAKKHRPHLALDGTGAWVAVVLVKVRKAPGEARNLILQPGSRCQPSIASPRIESKHPLDQFDGVEYYYLILGMTPAVRSGSSAYHKGRGGSYSSGSSGKHAETHPWAKETERNLTVLVPQLRARPLPMFISRRGTLRRTCARARISKGPRRASAPGRVLGIIRPDGNPYSPSEAVRPASVGGR
jgi:hypothetical protein